MKDKASEGWTFQRAAWLILVLWALWTLGLIWQGYVEERAKVAAKIDDLEDEQIRLLERVKVLERGG